MSLAFQLHWCATEGIAAAAVCATLGDSTQPVRDLLRPLLCAGSLPPLYIAVPPVQLEWNHPSKLVCYAKPDLCGAARQCSVWCPAACQPALATHAVAPERQCSLWHHPVAESLAGTAVWKHVALCVDGSCRLTRQSFADAGALAPERQPAVRHSATQHCLTDTPRVAAAGWQSTRRHHAGHCVAQHGVAALPSARLQQLARHCAGETAGLQGAASPPGVCV